MTETAPWDNSEVAPWEDQSLSSTAQSSSEKQSAPSTSLSSLGKNLLAGAEEAPGGLLSFADQVNPFAPGAVSNLYRSFGYNLPHDVTNFVSKTAVPAALNTFGWGAPGQLPQGVDPEKVAADTLPNKIARGVGNAAPLIPFGGVEGLLPNTARTIGSVTGANVAEAAVPTPYKPIAALAGSLLGGAPEAPFTSLRRAPISADQEAANYVNQLMEKAGKTATDLRAAKTVKPLIAAEAIGKTGAPALGALARRQGQTGDALGAFLGERASGTTDRMLSDYAFASGIDPAAALGDMDSIVKMGRKQAAPLYEQALNKPGATSDRLARFAQEPIVQQGMKTGIKIQRLNALADDQPFNPEAYAITHFNEAGDPVIGDVPNWRTWDAAKIGLDNMLEDYRNPITGKLQLTKMGSAINNVRGSLLDELDKVNPDYGVARGSAADYLSANDAFGRGSKMILNTTTTAKQLADTMNSLSHANANAFKGGIANALFNKAQAGRFNPTLFRAPIMQSKLSTVLGPDNAQKFLANMDQEAQMAKSGARMAPAVNSPTFELQDAASAQDNVRHLISGAMAASHLASGNYLAGASHAARLWAALKDSGMSVPVRDEAGRLLMMKPEELADQLDNVAKSGNPSRAARLMQRIAIPSEVGATQQENSGP